MLSFNDTITGGRSRIYPAFAENVIRFRASHTGIAGQMSYLVLVYIYQEYDWQLYS